MINNDPKNPLPDKGRLSHLNHHSKELDVRMSPPKTGFAAINNAQIYYETAGEGAPFVMIHAGVADSRQWNLDFAFFARSFQVVRYDLRGYGKSEPVEGEFNHLRSTANSLANLHSTGSAALGNDI